MTFSATISSLEDDETRPRWARLQQASLVRSPYARLEFVEDLAAVTSREVVAAFISDGEDVAGALLMRRTRGGISYFSPPEFAPYSAVCARSLPTAADIHRRSSWIDALVQLLDGAFAKSDLLLPPELTDVRPFQWADWDVSPLYTFRLPLVDPEEARAGWSAGARRTFDRGRERYEFRSADDSADAVVTLCLSGYERAGRTPPLSARGLEDLVARQVERGLASCYTAHENGRSDPDAGIVVLGTGSSAYYWIAGSIPGPAMTVLIGKLMDELSSEGFEFFDLVGANTPSVAEFKRRLNPVLIPYYRVRHIRPRFLRIFLSLRDALRS
jgi:hypothetical protein